MATFMDFNVKTLEKSSLSKTLEIASRCKTRNFREIHWDHIYIKIIPQKLATLLETQDLAEKGEVPTYLVGYQTVALNYVVDNIDNTMRKKKKDKDFQAIASPDAIKLDNKIIESIKNGRKPFKQYSRFSTVIENSGQLHKLQTPDIQAFDIIAVKPMSEKLFHIAATTLNIDIITIEVSERLPYLVKRPSINVALERGIYFEIQYSPAIRDSTHRKYMIANAQSLMRVCKGKNVIITSGCEKGMDLRGPHGVANLGLLFGMTSEQSKAAVSTNCQSLLLHAESRKLLKSTIGVIKTSQITEKDKWILEENTNEHEEIDIKIKTENENKQSIKRLASENNTVDSDIKKIKLNDIKKEEIK